MTNRLILTFGLFSILLLPLADDVAAQQAEMPELRNQIQVFTGVLREGLGLDTSPGFLGISSGRVTSVYLQNQGVLFEIRTPLANQRNRVSLNALASSIRGISGGSNPFEAMVRSQADRQAPSRQASESRVLSEASELAMQAVQQTAETLRAIDYQASIDAAIRDAYRRVRMLQDIGSINDQAVVDLRREVDSLAQQLQERLQQLRELESVESVESDDTLASTTTDEAEARTLVNEQRIEQLRAALQQLGDQARQTAAELTVQYEQAKLEYRQRWQEEIVAFEESLFGLLCDYGATLRELPDDEHVTVVLLGLGADTEQDLPADRLHVVAKADLLACQSGELDWQALRQRADSYNY